MDIIKMVTSNVIEAKRLASWICKRYLKYILIGALSSCISINVVLHMGAGLQYFCHEECLIRSIEYPSGIKNSLIRKHIQDFWLDPPSPIGKFKGNYNLKNPAWAKIGRWGEAQEFITKYFNNFKGHGTFIEVGAYDGEFMSLTLLLEQEKGYKGLLIEPNPDDYKELIAKNRHSYSINACASPLITQMKSQLWIRDTPENLPDLLRRIQKGSNRLLPYVSLEDRDLGKIIPVQCFNIATMALATFGRMSTDLLTISTHGGELDILDSIPEKFKIRVLTIMAPLATPMEMADLKAKTEARDMTMAYSKNNIHIFLPSDEVTIVS